MLALAALLALSMPTAAQSVTLVCLRTPEVQAAIVEASPADACGGVTEAHLAALTELDVAGATGAPFAVTLPVSVLRSRR